MLKITRTLEWSVVHSVFDDVEDGIPSDFTGKTIKSQIREKNAILIDGYYIHPLVMDVSVAVVGNQVTLSLDAAETEMLQIGDFLIDVVIDNEEFLICCEPVVVQGFITLSNDTDGIPDYVEIFETALGN